jgi:hypothetical protein
MSVVMMGIDRIHRVYRINGLDVNRAGYDYRRRDDGLDIEAAIGAGNDGATAQSADTDAGCCDQECFFQKIFAR